MNRQSEDMENLRNIHDENTRKIEIQKKVNEYNYQKYMAEIERLAQMDKYHYDVEKRKLEAQVKAKKYNHLSKIREMIMTTHPFPSQYEEILANIENYYLDEKDKNNKDQQKPDNEWKRIQKKSHHKEKMSKMEQQYQDKYKEKMDQSNKEHEIIMKRMDNEEKEREPKLKLESRPPMVHIQTKASRIYLEILKIASSLNSNQQGEEKPNNNNSQNMNYSGFQFPFLDPMFWMNNMFGIPFMNMDKGMNSMNSEEKKEK